MKILHICRQYYPSVGGVERFVADLAGHLAADGHLVEVATLNRLWHSAQRLPTYEVVQGIPVNRLPFIGGPLFFLAPTILKLVRKFDVLHVHNTDFFLDYLVATQVIHGKPIIVSTHGGFFHTQDQATLKKLYFHSITPHSLSAVSAVIPNSQSDAERFGPYSSRVVRIDNAIDYTSYAQVERQPIGGRCITVGRLAPNKNIAALLRVFAAAYASHPDLSLVVIGDGPLRAELERLSGELLIDQAVTWLGFIDNVNLREQLGLAEFFLAAATYEGFGLAVLEGMAGGVIPLANNISAFQALVSDRQNGRLMDYDQTALAAKILCEEVEAPTAQKHQLSTAAKQTAANYSWDAAIPKFEKVYAQVLSENKSTHE